MGGPAFPPIVVLAAITDASAAARRPNVRRLSPNRRIRRKLRLSSAVSFSADGRETKWLPPPGRNLPPHQESAQRLNSRRSRWPKAKYVQTEKRRNPRRPPPKSSRPTNQATRRLHTSPARRSHKASLFNCRRASWLVSRCVRVKWSSVPAFIKTPFRVNGQRLSTASAPRPA